MEYHSAMKRKEDEVLTHATYSLYEPQKHDAKGKKPVTKDYILYDSNSIKCPDQANLYRQKVD